MEALMRMLPLLVPVLLLDLALAVAAVIHILGHRRYRLGNRPLWLVAVTVFLLFGPLLYFALGRGEGE